MNYVGLCVSITLFLFMSQPLRLLYVVFGLLIAFSAIVLTEEAEERHEEVTGSTNGATVEIFALDIPTFFLKAGMFTLTVILWLFFLGNLLIWVIGICALLVIPHATFRDISYEEMERSVESNKVSSPQDV
eukprot:g4039.t1